MTTRRWSVLTLLVTVILMASGCGATGETPVVESPTAEIPPELSVPAATAPTRLGADEALKHIQRLEGTTLAIVNGEEVTWDDYEPTLRQALYSVSRQYELDWTDPAMQERLGHFQNDVLEQVVDRWLLRQMAEAQGIGISEADVAARLEEDKSRMLNTAPDATWEDFLKANGLTEASYHRYIYDTLLLDALIGAQEVETEAEQVHLRRIVVSDQAMAEAVVSELEAGRDFAELASLYSEDPETKDKGGDLGWFPPENLPTEIAEAAALLTPGQFSDVLSIESHYIIIQVLERGMRDLDAQMLRQNKQQALMARLDVERAAAQIEYLVEFSTSSSE